jgi:hypothetical protein
MKPAKDMPSLSLDETSKIVGKPEKQQMLVGVVGTSCHKLVEKETASAAVDSALDEALAAMPLDHELVIVSGGGLVPKLAFQWAKQHDCLVIQVASAAVRGKPKNVTRVEIGTAHGDESVEFVNMIQGIVRVGGGPQSYLEVQLFREWKPEGFIIEKDLALIEDGPTS